MTATARIATARAHDALLVPNAALRFSPEAAVEGTGVPASLAAEAAAATSARQRMVWTLRAGELTPVPVTVGMSDGQWTELTGGDLGPGTMLVVGVGDALSSPAASTSGTGPAGRPSVVPMGGRGVR
jgi:HlyD family secretion protein